MPGKETKATGNKTGKKPAGTKKSPAKPSSKPAAKTTAKSSAKAVTKTAIKSAARSPAKTANTVSNSDLADGQVSAKARALLDEILGIARSLDEASLEVLLKSAHALLTKRKIESFNRQLNVAAEKAARRRRELAAPQYHVSIEETKDGFFIIQLDDARVFFNRNELREITRICHAVSRSADPRTAAAHRLFAWFEKERSDLLVDAGINTERNPYLVGLYEVVVSTYKVKE